MSLYSDDLLSPEPENAPSGTSMNLRQKKISPRHGTQRSGSKRAKSPSACDLHARLRPTGLPVGLRGKAYIGDLHVSEKDYGVFVPNRDREKDMLDNNEDLRV